MRDTGITLEHVAKDTIDIRKKRDMGDGEEMTFSLSVSYVQAWDLKEQLEDFLGDEDPRGD